MWELEKPNLKAILETYDRTEKSFEEDVSTLREWIKTQPHLPEIMDYNRIKNFLLLNKCSVERTKGKIDWYYTIRTVLPKFFIKFDCPELQFSKEVGNFVLLPKLKDHCRIQVIKFRNKELVDKLDPSVHFAQSVFLQEFRLQEDYMFKDIFIVDTDGYSWGYFSKITPILLLNVLTYYEKVYSNRLQAVYIINTVPIIEKLKAITKTLIKAKLFERIHTCEDTSILHKVFPKEILPKDYGGDEKSVEELQILQDQKLLEFKDRFDELDRLRVDESLRPEKLKNDVNLGFYGNFKKLDVD